MMAVIHLTNAALVAALARLCALSWLGVTLAGNLFLLSPWSSESTFWVSGSFDSLAACGILIALVSALRLTNAASSIVVAGWLMTGLAGALIAVFSKEVAAVLPALIVVGWLLRGDTFGAMLSSRRALYLATIAAAVAAYLFVRANVLSTFSGAYGELGSLFARAPLLAYYRDYWYAAIRPPFPTGLGMRVTMLYPFVLLVVPAVIAWLMSRKRRLAALGALAFTLSMLPTAWMPPDIDVTNQRRLLYLPSVWVTLIIATALSSWWDANRSQRMRPIVVGAIVVTLATAGASTWFQRGAWLTATRISRSVIRQFEPMTHSTLPVRILNYPTRCVEGPRIHHNNVLRLYYGADRLPPLNIEAHVVTCVEPIGRVAGTSRESVRGYTDQANERVLTIHVP
jgi:hypothetical protein